MALIIPVIVLKLWNTWKIRVLILLSLFLQVFLNLAAQKRQQSTIGRKFRFLFWLSYLSADWVATSTIGFILGHSINLLSSDDGSPPSDILMLWAPFLLLHLGGPDSITAYALEDNTQWTRHLLQVGLQVGSTVCSIVIFSQNTTELLVPAILVLVSGIIKYGERNLAFYRASFDHFGDDWLDYDGTVTEKGLGLPIPKQFHPVLDCLKGGMQYLDPPVEVAVKLFGILKRLLVGPIMDTKDNERIKNTFDPIEKNHEEVLQVVEIQLSLLYEVLHTKLPVIASKAGFCRRMVSLGCVVAALALFIDAQTRYHLAAEMVDVFITYVLLVGAILLDLVSVWMLIENSDWFAICRFQGGYQMLQKRRWCNKISQSNIITYHVNECPGLLKKLSHYSYVIEYRCVTSMNFRGDNELWSFIVQQVKQIRSIQMEPIGRRDNQRIQEVWLMKKGIENFEGKGIIKFFKKMDYMRCLLALHVATELCFHNSRGVVGGECGKKRICKILSDYMFYLAVTKSTMISSVQDNWDLELEYYVKDIETIRKSSSNIHSSKEGVVCRGILDYHFSQGGENRRLPPAVDLARDLLKSRNKWDVMGQIWVQFMCYAAINCPADVHARRLSEGGQLLTLVWLLMNHFGLCIRSYTTLDSDDED